MLMLMNFVRTPVYVSFQSNIHCRTAFLSNSAEETSFTATAIILDGRHAIQLSKALDLYEPKIFRVIQILETFVRCSIETCHQRRQPRSHSPLREASLLIF